VHLVQQGRGKDYETALNLLCTTYWYPIFATARRRHGLDHHQAQDTTQAFWAWLLEKNHLQRVKPEAGKLRNFLLGYFDNFYMHEWRAARTKKRVETQSM
jgi:RNA polymerase sigma-70 factor (ECF subfamily)